MKTLLASSLFLLGLGSTLQADVALTVTPPQGALAGSAGSDVGWSFTITSDPTYWVSAIASDLIAQTSPSLGVYTDFIGIEGGPTNGVLAPKALPWTESFDDISHGIGAFTIDPGAVLGASDSGTIEIQYVTYSQDPNVCPTCAVGTGSLLTPFTVDVVAPAPTPEPSEVWCMAVGCGLLLLRRYRRR